MKKAASRVSKTSTKTRTRSARAKQGNPWLLAFCAVLVGVLALISSVRIMGWAFIVNSNQELTLVRPTTASGTLYFNALRPEEGDKGEVHLLARRFDSDQAFADTGVRIPLEQNAEWAWRRAMPGVNYDLKAVLYIDGKLIKETSVHTVTAPAHDVELPMTVTWRDLPADVVAESDVPLGGTVTINGYIPPNSQLEVYVLSPEEIATGIPDITETVLADSRLIATVTTPEPSTDWQWDSAVPLQVYHVVSVLRHNNQIIGVSEELSTAEASEHSLAHVINSTALPASVTTDPNSRVLGTSIAQGTGTTTNAGKATISGTVYLNGPQQANTSLLLLWRKPGESEYKVINRYQNPDNGGTRWSWDGAEIGGQYEITAALQVNEQNTSVAPNPQIVRAPATKVNFTINTYYVIPQTSTEPAIEACINRFSDNILAVVRLPRINGAGNYWLQVGDNDTGDSSIFNQKFSSGSNNDDMRVKVQVEVNKQHYMRYTYSNCQTCSNQNNFAPWSQTVAFTCT